MDGKMITKEFIQWIIDNHPDPAEWICQYIKKEEQFHEEIKKLYVKQINNLVSTYLNRK